MYKILLSIWKFLKKSKIFTRVLNAMYGTDFFGWIIFFAGKIGHIFKSSQTYFKSNKDRIKKIKSKLADQRSRFVYENMIKYRCTRNRNYLKPVIEKDQYYDSDIIKLTDHEVFVDCGAFDGDTIRTFLSKLPNENNFKEIIAFEPEPHNFEKLSQWATGGGMAG